MNTCELLTIAFILRVAASFRDGWSARRVKWLPWHIVGWIYRDAIIAWILLEWLGWPWASVEVALVWASMTLINFVLHRVFYALGENTIKYFK